MFHRCFAAFSALLLMQLTLLGSGTLCALHGAQNGLATRAVAARPSAESANAHSRAHTRLASRDVPAHAHSCDASGGAQDCGLPASPGSCTGMTACAVATAPAVVTVADAAALTSSDAIGEPAALRSGPASAPELPPPRA